MTDTSNSAATPVPFSPFSSAFSINSDNTGTSEEPGDLGAFSTVFRALNQLQRPQQSIPSRIVDVSYIESDDPHDDSGFRSSSPSSSDTDEPSSESPPAPGDRDGARSTVWNHAPVASYLTTSSRSDLEDETDGGPTLGALESALVFLAKERLRLSIKLDHEQSGVEWRSPGVRPKRASRKAKNKRQKTRLDRLRDIEEAIDGDESRTETAAEVSSSYDSHDDTFHGPNASTIAPIFRQSTKARTSSKTPTHSKTALPSIGMSPEAHALKMHLTSLAIRLSEQFPSDARALRSMTFDTDRLVQGAASFTISDRIEKDGFYDPRDSGNAAIAENAKVHVFVDHSNILVGFLEWIKRQSFGQSTTPLISVPGAAWPSPTFHLSKPKLSHASLILLLERGRACGKRVLVASSPLHQGVDDIVEMGYEVSVLQRVAIKEGASSTQSAPMANSPGKVRWIPDNRRNIQSTYGSPSNSTPQMGEPATSGGSSTESGQEKISGAPLSVTKHPFGHRRYPSAPSALPSPLSPASSSPGPGVPLPQRIAGISSVPRSSPRALAPDTTEFSSSTSSPAPLSSMTSNTGVPTSRPRFREEAVDELLQLKLLQVLVAATDRPPRGSTIVLATGDGASSQFNRDGFVGCVRQAVHRGWRVELVGWEEARSRAWADLAYEFQERRKAASASGSSRSGGNGGLYMISLEKWGFDLLDASGTAS